MKFQERMPLYKYLQSRQDKISYIVPIIKKENQFQEKNDSIATAVQFRVFSELHNASMWANNAKSETNVSEWPSLNMLEFDVVLLQYEKYRISILMKQCEELFQMQIKVTNAPKVIVAIT
jgi:hypothetical protein